MDGVRYLHFGTEWVQGAMRIVRPDDIEIEYVRQMMSWLLFLQSRQQILQLGLGAGALTRFCHRRLRDAHITVVEASGRVIDTAYRWFRLPVPDRRLSIVHQDAGAFVQQVESGRFGVIQCDLYDQHARGPVLDSLAFYEACRNALSEPGILVVNLFGEHASYGRNASRLARVFGNKVLTFPKLLAGNVVMLAFKGPPFSISWSTLEQRGGLLAQHLGLEGPDWVGALRSVSAAGAGDRLIVR